MGVGLAGTMSSLSGPAGRESSSSGGKINISIFHQDNYYTWYKNGCPTAKNISLFGAVNQDNSHHNQSPTSFSIFHWVNHYHNEKTDKKK